jgi:hypothetical protein
MNMANLVSKCNHSRHVGKMTIQAKYSMGLHDIKLDKGLGINDSSSQVHKAKHRKAKYSDSSPWSKLLRRQKKGGSWLEASLDKKKCY